MDQTLCLFIKPLIFYYTDSNCSLYSFISWSPFFLRMHFSNYESWSPAKAPSSLLWCLLLALSPIVFIADTRSGFRSTVAVFPFWLGFTSWSHLEPICSSRRCFRSLIALFSQWMGHLILVYPKLMATARMSESDLLDILFQNSCLLHFLIMHTKISFKNKLYLLYKIIYYII